MASPCLVRLLVVVVAVVLHATVPSAQQPPRIVASLETSALKVENDVAEATFKIVVTNEEEAHLSGVFLVFEDGFAVSVGDVGPESSASSEAVTRTFDLSQKMQSLAVPFPATLKFAVDGNAVEQSTSITLHLQPE